MLQFFLQSYNLIFIFNLFFYMLLSENYDLFFLIITIFFSNYIIGFFKNYFIESRPYGAANCGDINNPGKIATSFGLPSGHSTMSVLISTYLILYLKNKNELTNVKLFFLILMPLLVMYSRVFIFNCHTISQVIWGAILGVILGYLSFEKFKFIKNYFNF